MVHLLLELSTRRPSTGWGLSRLSIWPNTRDGHQPVLTPPRHGEDMGGNSSPARGGGPSQTVEGHVQRITTPEGQNNQSVPLPHASHGPPPHSGEDIEAMHQPSLG